MVRLGAAAGGAQRVVVDRDEHVHVRRVGQVGPGLQIVGGRGRRAVAAGQVLRARHQGAAALGAQPDVEALGDVEVDVLLVEQRPPLGVDAGRETRLRSRRQITDRSGVPAAVAGVDRHVGQRGHRRGRRAEQRGESEGGEGESSMHGRGPVVGRGREPARSYWRAPPPPTRSVPPPTAPAGFHPVSDREKTICHAEEGHPLDAARVAHDARVTKSGHRRAPDRRRHRGGHRHRGAPLAVTSPRRHGLATAGCRPYTCRARCRTRSH